jgi:hypothetical protein
MDVESVTECSFPFPDRAGIITLPASECGIRDNVQYNVTVRAENMFGFSNTSNPATVYTTDVQWASVEQLDNSSLLLMCVFAEGSRARGCQLTIKLSSTGKVQIIVQLHRTNHSAKIRELYENHVDWGESPSVVARDIEADGTIADNGIPGDVTLTTARDSSSAPTVKMPPYTETDTEGLKLEVIIPLAVVTGILLVLVLITLILILYCRQRKLRQRVVQSMPHHVYEEVNSMTFNTRYLAHKLHNTSGGHTPSSGTSTGIPNTLQIPNEATYSYAVCGATPVAKAGNTLSSCAETDTYELMKPSGSVKTHVGIATADNVCYTLEGH